MKIKRFSMGSSYQDALRDPRWQKKRLKILERDGWKCVECNAEDKPLHVHHSYYHPGFEGPWAYPDHSLLTLCEECHSVEESLLSEIRQKFIPWITDRGFNRAQYLFQLFLSISVGLGGDERNLLVGDPLTSKEISELCESITQTLKTMRNKSVLRDKNAG